jgi:hypothetical protein
LQKLAFLGKVSKWIHIFYLFDTRRHQTTPDDTRRHQTTPDDETKWTEKVDFLVTHWSTFWAIWNNKSSV